MISLAKILHDEELCGCLELDLLDTYKGSIDLLDFWRGTLSLRRLILAYRGLPRESRLMQKLGKDKARWGQTEHFLCDQLDLLNKLVWLSCAIAKAGGVPDSFFNKPPDLITRPGEEEAAKPEIKFGNAEDIKQLFGG
jgi:hypothetical protein